MKTPQHLLSEFSGTGLPEEKQPGPALSAIPVAEIAARLQQGAQFEVHLVGEREVIPALEQIAHEIA